MNDLQNDTKNVMSNFYVSVPNIKLNNLKLIHSVRNQTSLFLSGSNNKIHLPDIQAVVKITEKAMKEAFMSPFPEHQPPPPPDKTPLPAAPSMHLYNYQRLVDLCRDKTNSSDLNLAKELAKLSGKPGKLNSAAVKNTVPSNRANCIYCQLVMRRLDLYQSAQFGVTSERMLIYKRMQKQTN